ICCEHNPIVMHLRSDIRFMLAGPDASAQFTVRQGERHDFALAFDDHTPAVFPNIGDEATSEIERTLAFWRDWSSQFSYRGEHGDAVLRSALVLKLLSYAPPARSSPHRRLHCRNASAAFAIGTIAIAGCATRHSPSPPSTI